MTHNRQTMPTGRPRVQPTAWFRARLLRRLTHGRSVAVASGIALLLAGLWPVAAQKPAPEKPAAEAESSQAKPGEATKPPGPAASIEGFRSALFGMTETQLRQAVEKDFPGAAAKLKKTVHPSEKTTVLSVSLPDLLPHTGTAQISYILGYKSKHLIQINIVWRSDGSQESDETVVGTANSLRDYFAAQSYKPGSELANRPIGDNSIVVFRGADAKDRMIMLILNGAAGGERKDKERTSRAPPLSLALSYVADATHPDVFRIHKGQF